ncbi:tautomerase family protein [Paucibacter sp. KCTC 42545]|jgi:4-oxalocrotonate tautomerase|uniref:tautomerase family protein n=1 Tax=Paucibacter sp. KCTC 42545 TaxID=1768242 RepID=UPI000733BAB5|nr:4-oxalocrotonate tautomerase family protein [Paucibacter sp. KCTC 42545]ALT76820.1 4-oxalocrotonate tautomerase [Paucibacter sp. KCTC 42545]
MPILNVKVSSDPSPDLTSQINSLLLDITSRILKKKPELTAIAIDYVSRDHWSIGGKSLRDLGKNSVYFDIKITDETNTKDEKARYIAEAFTGFEKLLGELDEKSYVYIQDVRAATYGYGGRTQEYRYQNS